jgi:hypothetical protein
MTYPTTCKATTLLILAALMIPEGGPGGPARADASTLLSDDFESYPNDSWPPTWDAKWHAVDAPVDNGIRSDPENASNQALKLYGIEDWSASATRPLTFTDNFVVSARVWNGSEPRRPGWGRGSIGLEGGSTLFTFYADGTFPGGTPNLATFQTERWYDTTVHYQRQGSDVTLRYWLDGSYVGQRQFTLSNLAAELAANRLELNGGSSAYFDDVRVTSVPEPGCLALAVVGVAVFAWKGGCVRNRGIPPA